MSFFINRNRAGGNPDRLKAYLAQAAECAARTNGIYRRYYERMVERGKHRMIILNNIRNKIIHT
ncbi:MAG: IS110 family transposase, partial [Bacteroidaceae bacterium]|nr:IS110 family transposase [Bacteroidaceae bacterium]